MQKVEGEHPDTVNTETVAERQQPGVTPDQIQSQRDNGVAEDLAHQRQGVGRDL